MPTGYFAVAIKQLASNYDLMPKPSNINGLTETKMPNGSRQFQVDMTRIPSTEIGWASFSSLTLSVIPGIGDLKDFQEVVTGVDLITGEYLSPGDRVVTVVCAFVPVVSGRACRVIKKGFVNESTLEKALKIEDAVNGCFTAGTVISTEIGNLAIETVKAGDYVWSENPATGEKALKEEVRTYIHSKSTLIHVYIDDTMIETTEEHPFWVENKGWTLAANLNTNDVLRLKSGETAQISKVEQIYLENPVQVYNFEVKDWHTYFVSEESVLVHNSCGVDDIIKGAAEAVSKLKGIFSNVNSKLDELFANIKKITKFDNYYEVVTPDGVIVRIERSEISNFSKIDEIAENSAKADSAVSRGAFQSADELGEAIVDIDTVDDGLGNLDWDAIVSKKGETRIDHINRHAVPKPERASHGVFYNNPVDEVNTAWAKSGTVTPIDDTMGGYIYNIPVENVAYESGTTNTGKIMNYVTIVTKKDTNELFAAFPSFGDYGLQYLK